MSKTTVTPWRVATLANAFRHSNGSNHILRMPTFQRGVVWSPSKQSNLIRSLKAGYPVGSLLFYNEPRTSKDDPQVSLLIDGLQRTTSITRYMSNPLLFMEIEDLNQAEVEAFIGAYRKSTSDDIAHDAVLGAIKEWMSITGSLDPGDGFDAYGLITGLNANLELEEPVEFKGSIVDSARKFLKSIQRECDISDIEVPVLFYEGPQSELPEIFERINATGTKLSKYEIFAASWVNQETQVATEKVLDAIRARYKALMDSDNISISGVRADGMPEQLSLFDYLFGLGKVLAERFPLLFGNSEDPSSMVSIAFTLATVCYGLPLSDMGDLPEKFERNTDKRIDPIRFEEALIEATEFVNNTLAPYIGLKLNADKPAGAHTDLQIASMIARAFVGRQSTSTWEIREGADRDRERLEKLLPTHYLIDVLQQNWRGSGDSRLMEWVWERQEGNSETSKGLVPSKHYLREYSKEDFERVLDQWFDEQIQLSQRSRAYVTTPAKAFLKYVYAGVVTVMAEAKERFELDHIFPVSRLVDLAKSDEDGWPISAVSNLALFDWRTNREKSRLDLVQYIERQDPAEKEKKRQAVQHYLLVDIQDTAITMDPETATDLLYREEYLAFLRKRFEVMKQKAAETLGLESASG